MWNEGVMFFDSWYVIKKSFKNWISIKKKLKTRYVLV